MWKCRNTACGNIETINYKHIETLILSHITSYSLIIKACGNIETTRHK